MGGTLCLAVLEDVTLRVSSDWGVPLLPEIAVVFE
jgi:hypothetical protein